MPVVVKGYREFLRALDRGGKETKKMLRDELRSGGEIVRADAQARFARINQKSAAGYRVAVRQRGVAVEQRLVKTTGKHPEWGVLQMRVALIPASAAKEPEIERHMERALDRVCNRIERR